MYQKRQHSEGTSHEDTEMTLKYIKGFFIVTWLMGQRWTIGLVEEPNGKLHVFYWAGIAS
jgi:hypothetical protein